MSDFNLRLANTHGIMRIYVNLQQKITLLSLICIDIFVTFVARQ